MNYRAEIDGLRAVAVIPVILFHAGLSSIGGGFLGVDLFFVISGYLITSIIVRDLEAGLFSFLDFYERRARRILPVLFFIISFCIPFAWIWMLPDEFETFSASVIAVVLFVSNIFFWSQSNYFDQAAEFKPLLHTWSLSVEEQFYIFFPIVLMVLWRFGRNRVHLMIALFAVIGLIICEYASRHHSTFNFYWLPTRAWELLAGSLCAFVRLRSSVFRDNVLSSISLLFIVYSIFFFDESMRFPSVYTLIPVLGACGIIVFARQGTIVASLLSLKIIVGVGLISYSLYLWHQPIFAFARLRSLTDPSFSLMISLALLSVALAYLSWRFIEVPTRRRGEWPMRRQQTVFAFSGSIAALLVMFGLVGVLSDGFPKRLPDRALTMIQEGSRVSLYCKNLESCAIGDPNGVSSGIAFVGDSHMGRYAFVLDQIFDEERKNAEIVSAGWCAPLLNYNSNDSKRNPSRCKNVFQRRFQALIDDQNVKMIVLSAEWALYTTGRRYKTNAAVYDFTLDGVKNSEVARNSEEFEAALNHTINVIHRAGKAVSIIMPIPEYDVYVPTALIKRSLWSLEIADLRLNRANFETRNKEVRSAFIDLGRRVTFIDVSSALCQRDYCYPYDSDFMPLYVDDNHLSDRGLNKIKPILAEAFDF